MNSDHSSIQDGWEDGQSNIPTSTAMATRRPQPTTEQSMHAVSGLEELTQKPSTSCIDSTLTSIAHHAQCGTLVQLLIQEMMVHTWTSTESWTGDQWPTEVNLNSTESTSTDTVPDTRRPLTVTEMSNSVVTGLRKLIQKLDSSSSDTNLTGIAHLVHSTIPVPLLTLLLTEIPESISTESQDGRDQTLDGRSTSRELHTTDTAQDTRSRWLTPELLRSVLNG